VDREREVRLDGHVLLSAEPAADVGCDHADPRCRDAEDLGDVAEVLDHLRGGPDHDDAVLVEPGDSCLGLQVRVVDQLRPVLALHDDVGFGERRVDVAAIDRPLRQQVSQLVDARRALGERLRRIGDDGKLLVLDTDRLLRVGERVLGLGQDEGDGLAVEPHPVGREDLHARLERAHLRRLTRHVDPDLVVGNVLAQQHSRDARHLHRDGHVAHQQPPRRDLRSNEARVHHAGQIEVGRIPRVPEELLDGVVTADRAVDDAKLVCLRGSNLVPAHAGEASRPLAARIASTIPS